MKTSLPLFALAAFASALPAQNLLLPDNHHLGESATQLQSGGSTNWWGTTAGGRRMMVLYDASHFTSKAAVGAGLTITHLRFRGEDAERNTGGQVYSTVSVSLYKTTLNSANMATNGSTTVFATNLTPTVGTTSLLGATSIPAVVVAPSLGTGPNNWMIDLDLTGVPMAVFDPLNDGLGEVNLLVDISWTGYANGPSVPPSATTISMIATQDTSAHGAGIRGRGIYAATPGAATGTASSSPPVIGVEFVGGGGYATLIPATTEYIGASCGGSASSFHQLFVQNQPFDLANTGMTLIPDVAGAPTRYIVTAGAPPVDTTQLNPAPNSTGDDSTLAATPLGFTFLYPGGSTPSIRPTTNGAVWMDIAMSAADSSPTLLEWLGNTSTSPYTVRFAPFWHDFHAGENTTTHFNSGLHVRTVGVSPNQACYVTWFNVGEFNTVAGGGQSVSTMQCVFFESSNVVEFRYGAMDMNHGGSVGSAVNGITGFTRGRLGGVNSVDPQSRDLSHELPFATGPEIAGNVSLSAVSVPLPAGPVYGARMFGGQTLVFGVGNVPPAPNAAGLINLDLVATMPGFQFAGITAPGCMISTGIPPLILGWETFLAGPAGGSPSSFSGTLGLNVQHAWLGATITGQAIGLDLSGGPDLVVWASNTTKWVVGLD